MYVASLKDASDVKVSIVNRPLDYAYARAKSNGVKLRIASLDDERRLLDAEYTEARVNVDVNDGIVRKCWVG
jgi:hypothetical protein